MPDTLLTERDGQSLPGSTGAHIPRYLTSFIGRKSELEALGNTLERAGVRLLTLSGPGGSGKTRLASRLASEFADNYEDGVCWVKLAGLTDPDLVIPSIVTELDIADVSMRPPMEALTQTLNRRQVLLVIDNCEHLLERCTQVVNELLRTVPHLKIIATSRQRLAVPGETNWVVSGLSVPDLDHKLDGEQFIEYLHKFEAISLFLERARLTDPTFHLSASLAPVVLNICRKLDGIPLALELAAARLGIMGMEQLAERLTDQLDLLATTSPMLPARQQSLRSTLEWSYALLSEKERDFFSYLGVFRGSFSLEAAETIAKTIQETTRDKIPEQSTISHISDYLGSLVDKSLIVVEEGLYGRRTYRLLETIRSFAEEKLAATGQEKHARDAHLAFYHQHVVGAESKIKGPDQQQWVARLEKENDNLRAALRWALDQAQSTGDKQAIYCRVALEMASSLFWFWSAANFFSEGRRWLEASLALPVQTGQQLERANALQAAGSMAWLTGDFHAAQKALEESLRLFQQSEEAYGIAFALMMIGRVHLYQGDAHEALKLAQKSMALFKELDATHDQGLNLGLLSAASAMIGDYKPARRYAEEMLEIFQAIGDPYFTGLAMVDLGWAAYHQGDLVAAVENLSEGLAWVRRVDSLWIIAQSLNYLAEIARYQGNYQQASDYLEESLALAEEIDARAWLAQGSRNMGYVSLHRGRAEEAANFFLDSLAYTRQLGDQAGILMALEGLAAVAANERAWSLATHLFDAVQELREKYGPPRTPAERKDKDHLTGLMSSSPIMVAVDEDDSLGLYHYAHQVAALFKTEPFKVSPDAYKVRIHGLGPTQVIRGGTPLAAADWSYAKPKELLFYLISNAPVTKAQAGLVFWPDATPEQLRRNFRAALYHLRKALGDREWVLYEEGRYSFNKQLSYFFDVEAFEERVASAQNVHQDQPEAALAEITVAINLYRGEFLEDMASTDWATLRREELHQEYLMALSHRASLLYKLGKLENAIEAYRQVLSVDNLAENAHRGLMRTYASLGHRNRALRHYQEFRQLLKDELGVEPESQTSALYRDLKAGE